MAKCEHFKNGKCRLREEAGAAFFGKSRTTGSVPLSPLEPPCRPIIDGSNDSHPAMVAYKDEKWRINAENRKRGYAGNY